MEKTESRSVTAKHYYKAGTITKNNNIAYMSVRNLISGKLVISVGEEEYEMFPGDTFISNPYDEYNFCCTEDAVFYGFIIDVERFFDELGIPALTKFSNYIPKNKDFQYICEKINEEYEKHPSSHETMLNALTTQLLIILCRYYSVSGNSESGASFIGKHKIARQAIEYIHTNCHKGITTSDISKHINVSTSYLCRCFKESTGKSVLDYAESVRCRKAFEDLSLGIYSVTYVAEKYGFNSLSYFNRRYKEFIGTNPGDTLRKAKKRRVENTAD